MNKITKRIMALVLSLVMVLGCVPSFVNEASAIESTKIKIGFSNLIDKKTINEVSIDTLNFYIDQDIYYYRTQNDFNNYVTISIYNQNDLSSALDGTTTLQKENKYQIKIVSTERGLYSETGPDSFSFGSFDQTTIFDINGISDWIIKNATCLYENSALTITFDLSLPEFALSEILATVEGGFPTTLDKAWANDNGDRVIFNNSYLEFYESDLDSPTLTIAGTETISGYSISKLLSVISFVMKDGKLDTITIEGKGYCNGTYKPADILISKVNLISTGVLATIVQTLKYEAKDETNAHYSLLDNPNSDWFDNQDLAVPYTLSNPGMAYKKLVLTPKDGYKFNEDTAVSLNGTGIVLDNNVLNDDGTLTVVIQANVIDDFSKSATITLPITIGTSVEQIKNNISLVTTATAGKASIVKDQLEVFDASDKDHAKGEEYTLENDKEYFVKIKISDDERLAYNSVMVNNESMSKKVDSPFIENNIFYVPMGPYLCVNYSFKAVQPSSNSSKKYKASDNKDTAEKISGSGKKGSTRTITPIEGRKVSSIIVTDKNGNKVDVTLNEDGTYSFIQPASDVNIEVNYKNREITLTIGSTEASVDDVQHNLDVCPLVRNDRTMLPIRFIAENLGAKVEWNEKNPDTVIITRGETKIEITLGSDVAKVNGEEYKLDSVAFAENDRTYMPVRFISEKLNAIVEWNEEKSNEVKIYEVQ